MNNGEDRPYSVVADYMQVPATANFNFFNTYGSIAMMNDLPVMGHNVIGDPMAMSIVRGYQNQGSANALNTEFQFAGYKVRPPALCIQANSLCKELRPEDNTRCGQRCRVVARHDRIVV